MNLLKTDSSVLWSWSLVWFTLPLWNLGNSLSIVLFGVVVVYNYLLQPHAIRKSALLIPLLFAIYFAMHFLGDLNAGNGWPQWVLLERKLALLFVPGLILLLKPPVDLLRKFALAGLISGLGVASIVMLFCSAMEFFGTGQWNVFFYHSLTEPFRLGAIYYSLLLATVIIVLCIEPQQWLPEKWENGILLVFILLLFLAASKLFVVLTLPFVLYKFYSKNRIINFKWPVGIFIGILFIAALYPVLSRYAVLSDLNLQVLHQDNIGTGTAMNGVNLRLLQWKFGLEILAKQKAWWFGTGISERQELLNSKYKQYNMYTGRSNTADIGFLNMNFHNQWMETLVGKGLIGLFCLIGIFIGFFFAPKSSQLFPWPVLFILFFFFFTESVLERQIGLLYAVVILSIFMGTNVEYNKLSPKTKNENGANRPDSRAGKTV